MVEKTDKPKPASKDSQTVKRTAKKRVRAAGKTKKTTARKPEARKSEARNSEAKKPAASKARNRAAKAVAEKPAVTKDELAARRIAGGKNAVSTKGATTGATKGATTGVTKPATQVPKGSQAPEPAPIGLASGPASGKRGKTEPRTRAGENADGSPRPNTLVPTNGIHTTERRIKRKLYQNRGVMGLIAATLLGIVILGEQTTPPNLTEFEREIAASQAIDTFAGHRVASSPPGIVTPKIRNEKLRNESASLAGPEASQVSNRQDKSLDGGELVEIERLLARLDLVPNTADGIVDNQTEAAIRLYQEIAGLPVNGAPSRSLLADIREVVKILEDGG